MAKIKPSDDAIAVAAATLARTLVDLRRSHFHDDDFAKHEKYLISYYSWAVDQLVLERNS
jgi:hypothetical protein